MGLLTDISSIGLTQMPLAAVSEQRQVSVLAGNGWLVPEMVGWFPLSDLSMQKSKNSGKQKPALAGRIGIRDVAWPPPVDVGAKRETHFVLAECAKPEWCSAHWTKARKTCVGFRIDTATWAHREEPFTDLPRKAVVKITGEKGTFTTLNSLEQSGF